MSWPCCTKAEQLSHRKQLGRTIIQNGKNMKWHLSEESFCEESFAEPFIFISLCGVLIPFLIWQWNAEYLNISAFTSAFGSNQCPFFYLQHGYQKHFLGHLDVISISNLCINMTTSSLIDSLSHLQAFIYTLPNSSHLKIVRIPKGNEYFPTIHFSGVNLAVSFRVLGTSKRWVGLGDFWLPSTGPILRLPGFSKVRHRATRNLDFRRGTVGENYPPKGISVSLLKATQISFFSDLWTVYTYA